MKPVIKLQLTDDSGTKFFGEGPCRLLQLVEQTGSVRGAAFSGTPQWLHLTAPGSLWLPQLGHTAKWRAVSASSAGSASGFHSKPAACSASCTQAPTFFQHSRW